MSVCSAPVEKWLGGEQRTLQGPEGLGPEADLPGSSYAHSADFRVCVMGASGAEAGDSIFFACWIALKTTCKTL